MKSKCLNWLVSFVILLTLPGAVSIAPLKPTTQASHPLAVSAPDAALLQFTAGGHVIGFGSSGVYLAALDHALHIEFVSAVDVHPLGDSLGAADGLVKASSLGRVTYPDLWRGVSVVYQASADGILESTYRLAPGADVGQIRLGFNVPVQLDGAGGLRFSFERGWLSESAPEAWQEVDGARVPVAVAFEVAPDTSRVTFRLGAYDPSLPLVIDPVYSWHTFYGSLAAIDSGSAIAVDGNGNIYIAGTSDASWLGSGGVAPLHPYNGTNNLVGANDTFIVKLDGNGAYQWHTFYGSNSDDEGDAIAVDGNSNILVAGTSAATWQGDGGAAPLHAFSGDTDIVVLKLDGNGAYQWHTFYGSTGSDDFGYAVAIGVSDNILVTGVSNATWQGDAGANPLHAYGGGADIVVLKLNSSGAYLWHTFYGSAGGNDSGKGVAVDGNANIYVAGTSAATWQGDGGATPLHAYSGSNDIVVLELSKDGTYQWHTFYGSAGGDDSGDAIALLGSSNVYVTGSSNATWQGDGSVDPLHAYSGGVDIVVLKLNGSGVYQWHTFYGSANDDQGHAIAVGVAGNIVVTGRSRATWQGDGGTAPLHAFSGNSAVAVVKLNSSGTYLWHTFYGTQSWNYDSSGNAIVVDGNANIYMTGASNAIWGGPNPIKWYSGGQAMVALKLETTGTYQWSTFYGPPNGDDEGDAIAVDGSGNIYVAGWSDLAWQGDSGVAPLHAFNGGSDIVVVKLDSSGSYRWHTFYGSAGNDFSDAIAVDGSGNVYMTGFSTASWQGDGGVNPLHAHSGSLENIFVLKLNRGGTYQWHTFYGSGTMNEGYAIAVDDGGNVYVGGLSEESWQGDGGTNPLHTYSGDADMVMLKLNGSGAYQWHTFYGGSGYDQARAIAVSASGGVYVTGDSYASWQGDGGVDPLHAYSGDYDIVALKLNGNGAYQWHTFYGSASDEEIGLGIAVDVSENVYITGNSWNTWQGDGGANPLHAYGGDDDIFVLKLNGNGGYQWHTFYGSGSYDDSSAITLDGTGNVYITGSSDDTWQGDNNANPLHAYSSSSDIVILALNNSGAYQWHTFYGGGDIDYGAAIAVDESDNIYVAGASYYQPWQGDNGADPHHPFSGGEDIVVLKLTSYRLYLPLVMR